MHLATLDINGVVYCAEGDSLQSATERVQPWLLKAQRSYPHQEWKATVYEVLNTTEVSLIKPGLGRPRAA
jgi:hypothetical protein